MGRTWYSEVDMVTKTVPEVTALEAEAVSSLFLSDNLPDRFTAGAPRLDAEHDVWRVPVLLAYPVIGPVGETGQITVSTRSKEILSHTPVDRMQEAAGTLYDQHRDEIEAINL
jgi:hypothetical protein